MQELYLVIRNGTVFDRIHQVSNETTLIGRGEDCGVRLPSPEVSRHHAVLERIDGGGFRIRDLQSRNGTWIRNQAIEEAPLRPALVVQVGPYRLTMFDKLEHALHDAEQEEDYSTMLAGAPQDLDALERELTPAQKRVLEQFLLGRSEKECATNLGGQHSHGPHPRQGDLSPLSGVVARGTPRRLRRPQTAQRRRLGRNLTAPAPAAARVRRAAAARRRHVR